jgi:RNA polymerase sigma factor for flagellar operon FliA
MSQASAYARSGASSPDALLQDYAPLVKRIAHHLRGRLPDSVEVDDLVQVGLIALLDASRQYSASKGASFETYAGIRIRGAMLDEVRNTDWTPRSVYRRQRELTAAIRAVENRTGKPAEAREIAGELAVTLDEYYRMVTSAAAHRVFSLDQDGDDGEAPVQQIADPERDPALELESDEFRSALVEALRSLPEREALVMSLYYDDEFNLKEIGEVLGVTESRVCQIHGQALARVRARMKDSPDRGSKPRNGQAR